MLVGRTIGWILLLAALIVIVRDLIAWYYVGQLHPVVVGELWFELSPTSLQLAQPAIQRHVAAWLWEPVIVTFLTWPAEVVLAVPGIALAWFCRPRDRRRRRR
jgi:hypothetical protein